MRPDADDSQSLVLGRNAQREDIVRADANVVSSARDSPLVDRRWWKHCRSCRVCWSVHNSSNSEVLFTTACRW